MEPVGRGRKRPTLLDRMRSLTDEDIAQLYRDLEESRVFRYHAVPTQRRQDRCLHLYQSFVSVLLEMDLQNYCGSQKEKDEILFPLDTEKLFIQLELFLLSLATEDTDMRKTDDYISCDRLSQHRAGLFFWVRRIRGQGKGPDIWDNDKIFNHTLSRTLRFCFKECRLCTFPERRALEVGLSELRQLIDTDMASPTLHIDVAELHHLAWCMGKISAIRPGDIGQSRQGSQKSLRWKDITIVRGDEPGKFQVEIGLRSMSNSTNFDKMTRKLVCKVLSPSTTEDLEFSIAHRLLVVAIRHKMLVGIETIDDLLSEAMHHIRIKDEHLQKHIFFEAKENGAGLTDQPMSSMAIAAHLQRAGRKAGFPEDITFYALRRSANVHSRKPAENPRTDVARITLNYYEGETWSVKHDEDATPPVSQIPDLEAVRSFMHLLLQNPARSSSL
ncbi:hypothetical protein CONLIGDRAFT_695069 [Coniochaeta ligniaria NRRL 30616]|uniref:Uncharacterized protein n=1 Tax=Coniochaeta ligniaria NRRL 30616 TaxID=1408157 RepID=A0A1J7JU24_9PEZI|nr:hypothetical protein CONLIGDRAFT_695069 [Coniochaeta ligniaria NRRL 30616]